MKIQCDVCHKDEAAVFCVADEAALCSACDHRVHHANKLAGKHQRFSLLHPSPKQAPLCDICKDRRAFLFCQQDRAILCRECDFPIHNANEHTQKHTRFLLTGVKLSATSVLYSSAESADAVPNINPQTSKIKPSISKGTAIQSSGSGGGVPAPESCDKINAHHHVMNSSNSGSSISEFIDMLPGWYVDDFLDSSLSSPPAFYKNGDNDMMPLWEDDLESNMSGFTTEKMGIWVPQAPPSLNYQTQNQSSYQSTVDLSFGTSNVTKEQQYKDFSGNNHMKSSRNWSDDDSSFIVPQISPTLNASKRLRTFW